MIICGLDSAGNQKIWSLIYGDGGEVTAGTWSSLKELASAPAGGYFNYSHPFLDKLDVYRANYAESFTGTEPCTRPYCAYTVPETSFPDNLWTEPEPFNASSASGLAIAHSASHLWLTTPSEVWRAPRTILTLDLTPDVISLKYDIDEKSGKLAVELDNQSGRYAAPGSGALAVLRPGCQLNLSPGYRTTAGAETSPGLTFSLEGYEHISAGGKSTLILTASDGRESANQWHARHQFRWNKSSSDMSVKQILEFILARCGIKLEVISESGTVSGFYPDFTIHSGDAGVKILDNLLSFVPDHLFVDGSKAYLINPQPADASCYSYGTSHAIRESKYRNESLTKNRIRVEGYDDVPGTPVIADSFDWEEILRAGERLWYIFDRNINVITEAAERGQSILRKQAIDAVSGFIRVPVNCGQQLFDVIEITDNRAGLAGEKKRVLGLAHLRYTTRTV